MSNGILKASIAGGLLLWVWVAAFVKGQAGLYFQVFFFIAIPLTTIISSIPAVVLFTFWQLFSPTKNGLLLFNGLVFIILVSYVVTAHQPNKSPLELGPFFVGLIVSCWICPMALLISRAGVEKHNNSFKADA